MPKLKSNSKNALLVITTLIALICLTAVLYSPVKKFFTPAPTVIESTIANVEAISLDSTAVTYTYIVDVNTTRPVFVGNSIGYPIDPITGTYAKGTIINLVGSDGLRYPTWISPDGVQIVSKLKLHHDSWIDNVNAAEALNDTIRSVAGSNRPK